MATAQHPKASVFVQQRLFAGLTNFSELESRLAALPDEQSRGAAFEVFAEAYLATQRKYDAAQVWPHGSIPLDILKNLGLTQSDQGVDGVLQTLLGEFNAYQIKFRTGRPSLTWRELSTFIGLADSPHIHSRVLLTNCDELPAVLNDRQGFFCIRGADLDRLEAGDFRAMEAWLADAAFIAPKKSPQPHQTEALDALLPALQTHDRVSAIMACGTGKTLIALWVMEKLVETFGSRGATNDNSPAFQRRVKSTNDSSPAGTTEVSKTKPSPDEDNNAPSVQPSRWDSLPVHQQPSVETPGYVSGCPVGTNDGGVPAARILVLLPSLALLRQTLHEWLRETHLPSLAYLCVCSDPTVKEGIDALTTQQSDLDFQVSTDAASVRSFLDAPFAGVKMIFSTYQSASVVGAAMPPGEAFDFAVFDEAHKTAGREGRNFAFALDDKNLPIRKRLFLTATPRHYNPQDRDREGEARLLFSMDNPAVYGPQACRLTFAEAARRGIICGYKVIISVITSEMVTNELLSHGEVLVNGDAVRARQVANQIALRDAIEKYGVKKVFTFHRDVKSAQSFVSAGPEGVGTHLLNVGDDVRSLISNSQPEIKTGDESQRLVTSSPTNKFQTFHVNGSMPTARRERELRDFRAAARAVVSNARCLTEGVDVPAVDMVAFLSPRRSRVDIVQATGRAMRRSPGKTTGYVLVPLYVELTAGETVEAAVNRAQFDEVWDVLQSLQEQDDVLAEVIRGMREERGRTKGFDDSRFHEKVEVCGPSISLDKLRAAITTASVNALGASWDEWFGLLQRYKKREGDCLVKLDHIEDGFNLGYWVGRQRQNKELLTLGRKQKLEILGFCWDTAPSPLTEEQILQWADEHHQKTGKWPNENSGDVLDASGEKWGAINGALSKGQRGLPGGSSLPQLLADKRGVRNRGDLPDLTIKQILEWADMHHQKTGEWPMATSGDVLDAPGEKWTNIQNALSRGDRGLPGGSTLPKLLMDKRGVRNHLAVPDLTIDQILQWADAYHQKTGEWPMDTSGDVLDAPGEKWSAINSALFKGIRGLPDGSSLAQLLAEKRGIRNPKALPYLTIEQILKWADAHHQKTGQWPKVMSGAVLDAPGEKWGNIHAALSKGGRGLPDGSSLKKLLAEKLGVRNRGALPILTIQQILKWADAHHRKTGNWPNANSGEVQSAFGETWLAINHTLGRGRRGLAGGSSLAQLLAENRGVQNIKGLPTLTVKQILKWVDAHKQKTGEWPNCKSGEVLDAPGEKWARINGSFSQGLRGLPGDYSLAQLLTEKRGVRNLKNLPDLTVEQILKWADAHHQETGQRPKVMSGAILDEPGEKWANINAALSQGNRGLPGGSSLAKLLAEKRPAK
jgi:superfamily II DNA or RNA helicase